MPKTTVVKVLAGLNDLIKELTEKADELRPATGPEIARHFVEVRAFYELLGDVNTTLEKLKSKMAYEDVPAAFEREGVTTYTLKEGYRVTVSSLVRASCKDMEEAIKWMKAREEFAAIPKMTINASTLAAVVKDLATEGRELPDDLFNVHIGSNTSVTKVK